MRGLSLSTYDKWKLKAGATYANNSDHHHQSHLGNNFQTHDMRKGNLFTSQQVSETYILTFEELFKWPASIEDAERHERANSLGLVRDDSETCPCCLMNSDRIQFNWFRANIDKDLSYDYGTAIPCFFHLIKFYLVVVVLLASTMCFFYLYQSYNICNSHDAKGVLQWDL